MPILAPGFWNLKEIGTLKYVGSVPEDSTSEWLGVELEEEHGLNNGIVEGVPYFECKRNCGIFVKRSHVTKAGAVSPLDMLVDLEYRLAECVELAEQLFMHITEEGGVLNDESMAIGGRVASEVETLSERCKRFSNRCVREMRRAVTLPAATAATGSLKKKKSTAAGTSVRSGIADISDSEKGRLETLDTTERILVRMYIGAILAQENVESQTDDQYMNMQASERSEFYHIGSSVTGTFSQQGQHRLTVQESSEPGMHEHDWASEDQPGFEQTSNRMTYQAMDSLRSHGAPLEVVTEANTFEEYSDMSTDRRDQHNF
jgi:hypothetical protein